MTSAAEWGGGALVDRGALRFFRGVGIDSCSCGTQGRGGRPAIGFDLALGSDKSREPESTRPPSPEGGEAEGRGPGGGGVMSAVTVCSWTGIHLSAPCSGELVDAPQEPLHVAAARAPENTVHTYKKREKE